MKVLALALLLLIGATPAPIQTSQTPATATPGRIEGYRSAVFGMTEAQVRAAMVKDLGVTPDAVRTVANAAEGTTVLLVDLPRLDPVPGQARVSYILGATSRRLVHVNIIWSVVAPSDAQRESFVAAGTAVAEYLKTQPHRPAKAGPGGQIGPNAVLMFVAADDQGAAVELAATGIAFEASTRDGIVTASPRPAGPVSLRLSYIANVLSPDSRLPGPGAF